MLSSEEIRRFMEEDGIVDGIHVTALPSGTELGGAAANDADPPESAADGSTEIAPLPDYFGSYMASYAAFSSAVLLHTMQLLPSSASLPALSPARLKQVEPCDTLQFDPLLQAVQLSNEMALQSFSMFSQAFAGMFFGSLR